MANNPYVNKVELADGTSIIDISDTTAVASDVLNSKYFYTASGQKVQGTATGSTAAISVVDTTDSHGGTIREITALDISDTTAVASDVAQGKYFYTAQGVKTTGTGSGGTPSATAHTIYFEFSDNTNTTITAYYDDSFISDAITATTPTTYGQKTVTLAELDGAAWYQYDPTEQWETVLNDSIQVNSDTPYNSFWIPSLSSTQIPVGSVWRVTYNNVEYRLTAVSSNYGGMIGNPKWSNGTDNGTDAPFDFFNAGWGAWSGGTSLATGFYQFKIERLVS